MLCKIDINKPSELEFTLQVQGSTAKTVEPRFVIVGEDFSVICHAQPKNDTIVVSVPKLDGILAPGTYEVQFEVIVGDQIFVPVEDKVILESQLTITAKVVNKPIVKVKEDAEPIVQFTQQIEKEQVRPAVVEQVKPEPTPIIKAIVSVQPKGGFALIKSLSK